MNVNVIVALIGSVSSAISFKRSTDEDLAMAALCLSKIDIERAHKLGIELQAAAFDEKCKLATKAQMGKSE